MEISKIFWLLDLIALPGVIMGIIYLAIGICWIFQNLFIQENLSPTWGQWLEKLFKKFIDLVQRGSESIGAGIWLRRGMVFLWEWRKFHALELESVKDRKYWLCWRIWEILEEVVHPMESHTALEDSRKKRWEGRGSK